MSDDLYIQTVHIPFPAYFHPHLLLDTQKMRGKDSEKSDLYNAFPSSLLFWDNNEHFSQLLVKPESL